MGLQLGSTSVIDIHCYMLNSDEGKNPYQLAVAKNNWLHSAHLSRSNYMSECMKSECTVLILTTTSLCIWMVDNSIKYIAVNMFIGE